MSKKHLNEPLPLTLVRDFEKEYPGCWALADEFVANTDAMGIAKWGKEVFLPSPYAGKLLKVSKPDTFIPERFAVLSAWRRYKQIFHFNEELVKMLIKNANSSSNIPVEALRLLPFPAFYIEFEEGSCLDANGMFVCFDYVVPTKSYPNGSSEVHCLFICDNKPTSSITLTLQENMTFAECVENFIIDAEKHYPTTNEKAELREYLNKWSPICASLLLYICAVNADVSENEKQKDICIQKNSTVPFSKPKDVFREIRKWDVGFRVGATFQTFNSDSTSSGEGSRKRPHVRRAHFHHYWVGKKNSERKLIIKWISSLYVNAAGSNDVIASTSKI